MRVGILELLVPPTRRPGLLLYHFLLTKQYASITPQTISVWCRQLGHSAHYATYYGWGDPRRLLPDDLDVVFISSYTQVSQLAYALAKVYRQRGTLTVLGGPHVKAFPQDAVRFFDLVVKECDKELIADILAGRFDRGSVISSEKPFEEVPSVAERMPEIRASAFLWNRKRFFMTTVPMLASTGCPYDCRFCIDWNTPFRLLSMDRLVEDVAFLSRELPGTMMAFHDPNFGVKLDEVLSALETAPPGRRVPYVMESSLSILRGERAERLGQTNCLVVAPGVESWNEFSKKAAAGRLSGRAKVDRVVEQFENLYRHVPYLQANLMLGLDTDQGTEPVELTKHFMTRTPFVWSVVNIPHPFGGTPLFDEYLSDGRILQAMPFSFYYSPYLVTTLRHYDPITFYRHLVDIFEHATSSAMLRRRLASTTRTSVRIMHWTRTIGMRTKISHFRALIAMLEADRQFRAFHEGRSPTLPEFYHREYERMLGPYAPLMSRADRTPVLDGDPAVVPAPAPAPSPRPPQLGRRPLGLPARLLAQPAAQGSPLLK
jgi:hypothetical protein